MRLIKDHILRNVHGNVVLVPLSDDETDFRGMIVLNHTGEFICRMLQQDIDRDSLIAELAQEYKTEPEQVGAPDPKPLPYGEQADEHLENTAKTSQQVTEKWEQLKLKEKDGNKSVLAGVPDALPSLIKAYRVQDKARNVGFDWEDKGDVWAKVREELGELETELRREDKERSTEEFGDFLFSLINAARLYKINPDTALEKTNAKFIRRFNYIEQHSIKIGKPLKDMTLGEMDALWNEAKNNE